MSIESIARDAINCAVSQSDSGVIDCRWGLLADIVEKEFQIPARLTKPEIMNIDFDQLFEKSRWVGVAHGLNNEVTFYDKRRHEFSSATYDELEAHKRRSLNIAAWVTRNG